MGRLELSEYSSGKAYVSDHRATTLREGICNIPDGTLATGEPVEMERKGRALHIVADPSAASRLSRIRLRPGLINGDPEDLVEIDWSKDWNPDGNI